MRRLSLIRFELKRATNTLFTPHGIASILAGAALLAVIVVNASFGVAEVSPPKLLPVLGAAWCSLAAVYAIDRNRGGLVEDLWFALTPAARPQLVAIFLAWLPVAYGQALVTSALIVAIKPDAWEGALLAMHIAFVATIPGGLVMSALARLVPGFSLLSGAMFFIVVIFAQALAEMVGVPTKAEIGFAAIVYLIAAAFLYILLTKRVGQTR